MEINQNIAEYYDELYPVSEEQKVFYKKRMALFSEPVKFLRIGCGSGTFEHNLAREGSDVTGIETSQELLESANRKRRTQLMSVRYFKMSPIEMTRFLGKSFYNIISILDDRIIFTHDKTLMAKLFYDCRQLISQGGKLILSLTNFEKFKGKTEFELPERKSIRADLASAVALRGEEFFLEQILTNSRDKKFTVTEDAPVYLLEKSEIEKFAKDAGFSKVDFFSDFAENDFTPESDTLVVEISA